MQEQIRQLLVIGEAYIDKYGPDVFYEVTGTEPTEEVVEGEVVIDDDPKGQGDEGAEVHAQDTESEEPRLDVPEAAEGTQVQDGQEIADLYR